MLQYECGVLFIWSRVFQNLYTDKRFGSTLSVFINHRSRGWRGNLNFFTMKKKYVVPEAEIVEVVVEQGFAGSDDGGNLQNPNEGGDI